MKKFCVYGKGGIGKSTTVVNIAAAMAEMGLSVAVVGCDPKADSTRCLMGRRIPTVLDTLRRQEAGEIAYIGYNGILCVESGGPEPGTGCAGRGIVTALREINERGLLDGRDVVIYDVLGDVVCGGFSMPLRENIADDVYIVTTADFMSVFAANNICRGIEKYARTGNIRLGGIIYNGRSGRLSPEVAKCFAAAVGTGIAGEIPMSELISRAEVAHKTVIENFPESDISECFRMLAKSILAGGLRCIPIPLCDEEVEALCRF